MSTPPSSTEPMARSVSSFEGRLWAIVKRTGFPTACERKYSRASYAQG